MDTAMPKFEKTTALRALEGGAGLPANGDDQGVSAPPQDPDLELRRIARELGFDEAQYVVSPRDIPVPWDSQGRVPQQQADPHRLCSAAERRTGSCWMRHR